MSNVIRILLAEDNNGFRSALKTALLGKGFSVEDAANGKIAKDMLSINEYDLVITDIQMPDFTGLDLLKWIKINKPVPVILMTGFAQVLETKIAAELGADDFIAKPFSASQLLEMVRKHIQRKGEAATPLVNVDDQFCKISLSNFLAEKESEFGVYVRVSETKYIKIAHEGGKISEERVKFYKEKDIHYLYIRQDDFAKVIGFNLKIAKAVSANDQLTKEKKVNFMKHTNELILENVFVKGVDEKAVRDAAEFLVTSMDILTNDNSTFSVLDLLSTHADYLYAHSLGVSTFAVMIGKQLGWHSTSVAFRLAMGGLFHDIGKKEIKKDILEKPRPMLSREERELIESHPRRGKEILESLKTMPADVVQIVYEHHEDMIGQGYPRRIGKNTIHPLAKVVQVANIFCEYAVRSYPHTDLVPAHNAIEAMQLYRVDELDKDIFAALKKLFAGK